MRSNMWQHVTVAVQSNIGLLYQGWLSLLMWDFITIPLQPPFLTFSPLFWHFDRDPWKWPILTPKKVKTGAKKKVFPRIHMDKDILQKTGSKYCQIWPLWSHLCFTAAYRVSHLDPKDSQMTAILWILYSVHTFPLYTEGFNGAFLL